MVLSSSPVTVSSKVSVKLPDSPQDEGPGASGIATVVVASIVVSRMGVGTTAVIGISCRFASDVVPSSSSSNTVVTTVLKRLDLDEKISKDGRAESGVWRSVRVVKDMLCRSDGSGPVTVGYIPVQYDTVVEILGDGKTKLISTSPYDITFVIARALNRDVALRTGGADDVASGEVVVVNVNVEVRVLCETKTELNSELDAVLVVGTLMLLAEDMELPASELELVIKELESTEELVMVLELNSVEELDVKLKLSVDDEFVMGNSVAKPVEVLGLSILVNG